MPDQVNTRALHHVVEQLAQAIQLIATQAGDVPAVRRLRNDLERIQIDSADCGELQALVPARELEVIPDTPYDESLWHGVDDEGLGGFRQTAAKPQPHRRNNR